MQTERITKILSSMAVECLLSMKASTDYEKFRLYDDIFFLPEHDRAWFNCILAVHERLVGTELLPGGKTKAMDIGDNDNAGVSDIRSIIEQIRGATK